MFDLANTGPMPSYKPRKAATRTSGATSTAASASSAGQFMTIVHSQRLIKA